MKGPEVTVGEGGILDLDAVIRVMDDSFDPAFGEAWTAPQCAGLMPMPGVWLSLARAGTEIVGFTLGRVVVREAELLLLAVRRGFQHQGIGTQLLERFTLISTTRGAEQLHLEVREGNPAMKLYLRSGFAEVGRRRNYYTGRDGQIYDALTLARKTSI